MARSISFLLMHSCVSLEMVITSTNLRFAFNIASSFVIIVIPENKKERMFGFYPRMFRYPSVTDSVTVFLELKVTVSLLTFSNARSVIPSGFVESPPMTSKW